MLGIGSMIVTRNGMVRVVGEIPSVSQGSADLLRGSGVEIGSSRGPRVASDEVREVISPRDFVIRSQVSRYSEDSGSVRSDESPADLVRRVAIDDYTQSQNQNQIENSSSSQEETQTRASSVSQIAIRESVVREEDNPSNSFNSLAIEEARTEALTAERIISDRRTDAIDALLEEFKQRQEMGGASIDLDNEAKRGQVMAIFGILQPSDTFHPALNLVG